MVTLRLTFIYNPNGLHLKVNGIPHGLKNMPPACFFNGLSIPVGDKKDTIQKDGVFFW